MRFEERSVRHLPSVAMGPPEDPVIKLILWRPLDAFSYLITHMDWRERKAHGFCVQMDSTDDIEFGEAVVPLDDPPPPPASGYPLHVAKTWNRKTWVPQQFSSVMHDFPSEMEHRSIFEEVIGEAQESATIAYAAYGVALEENDASLIRDSKRVWEHSVGHLSHILRRLGIDVAVLGDPAFETRSQGAER